MVSSTGFWRKPLFITLSTLFILWIILFEFIVPENNFLPKPGIVLLAIPALFEDYHLILRFFATVSAIYLPGLLAYLLVFTFRQYIFKKTGTIKIFTDLISRTSVFFPPILFGILLIFWFPNSFITVYIFSFIVSISWWLIELRSKAVNLNESYLVSFKSFGADEIFVNKNITWNEVKPGVFKELARLHLHLWALVLIFEFISGGYGMGFILYLTLIYHDLSAIFLILIIISVTITAGYYFLRYVENRFIFWSKE